MKEVNTETQRQARPNVHGATRSTGPEKSMVRQAKVFVVAAGGVGELQREREEAASVSSTIAEKC